MTSFTSAVTGAGRKLNNYDFDLRVRASRQPTVRGCSSNATSMFILKSDKRMETAKSALASVCSAEAKESVAN